MIESAANYRKLPFLTSMKRLESRYGISMPEDTFIEAAFYIWKEIGNVAPVKAVFVAKVPEDQIIQLPKECEYVLDVAAIQLRGIGERSSMGPNGQQLEVEPNKTLTSSSADARMPADYIAGESVTFLTGDGFIKIATPNLAGVEVEVKYSSMIVGDDGLPLLNDLEIEAIASNMALREAEKMLFKNPKEAAELVKVLQPEADRSLQAAALGEMITEADIQRLMDIGSTWDRKTYGDRFNL